MEWISAGDGSVFHAEQGNTPHGKQLFYVFMLKCYNQRGENMNLENENNAQPTVQTQYITPEGCHVVLHFRCLSAASDVSESIAKVLVMAALRQKDEAI